MEPFYGKLADTVASHNSSGQEDSYDYNILSSADALWCESSK